MTAQKSSVRFPWNRSALCWFRFLTFPQKIIMKPTINRLVRMFCCAWKLVCLTQRFRGDGGLPPDALEKFYHANAEKLVPGLKKR